MVNICFYYLPALLPPYIRCFLEDIIRHIITCVDEITFSLFLREVQ